MSPPPPLSGHPRTARRKPRRQSGAPVKQLASLQFSKHLLRPPHHRCRLLRGILHPPPLRPHPPNPSMRPPHPPSPPPPLRPCPPQTCASQRPPFTRAVEVHSLKPPYGTEVGSAAQVPVGSHRCTPRATPTMRCVLSRNLLALVFLSKPARAWVVLPPALLWRRACAGRHQRRPPTLPFALPPAPAPASAPACDHGVVGRHPAGGQRPAQEMAKLSSRIVHGCPPRQWEVLRHTAQEAAMSSGREQRAAKAKMKTHDVSKTM